MAINIDNKLGLSNPFEWTEENFSYLFDKYYSELCFFVNKYLGDMDLSRSIVQDVYVKIWMKRSKISPTSSIKSYLYNSARNTALDHLRTSHRNTEMSETIENSLHSPFRDRIEEAELNDRINRSINALPEKCREVFVLCRFEELKYSQIAERLNISVKTVEMQMGIALKKLRHQLSENQFINVLISIFKRKKSIPLTGYLNRFSS